MPSSAAAAVADAHRREWALVLAATVRVTRDLDLARQGRLAGYHYLPATRADLLTRLGRTAEAADAYREALGLTGNDAEREFLAGRIRALAT